MGQGGLTRIDPQTNRVLAQIDLGNGQGDACYSVLALAGAVWVMIYDARTNQPDLLEQIDPATNRVISTIPFPQGQLQSQFAVDTDGIWLCAEEGVDNDLFRLDPRTGQVEGELKNTACAGVVLSAGMPWIVDGAGGTLYRITPAS
jgi:streptogramin lyase